MRGYAVRGYAMRGTDAGRRARAGAGGSIRPGADARACAGTGARAWYGVRGTDADWRARAGPGGRTRPGTGARACPGYRREDLP
ncbi:hypothetical protein Shyhy02_09400 [Streptomyces hygroscopicus subsp. hygroscopicus]|nr:hypothetical protein Shyhy02_09400 [Streptomyces hygroscopicus subsp. hygroscopicus]